MNNENATLNTDGLCSARREEVFKHFGVPEALSRIFPYGIWANNEAGFNRICLLPKFLQKSDFQRQTITLYHDSEYPAMLVIIEEDGPRKDQTNQDLINTIVQRAEEMWNLGKALSKRKE